MSDAKETFGVVFVGDVPVYVRATTNAELDKQITTAKGRWIRFAGAGTGETITVDKEHIALFLLSTPERRRAAFRFIGERLQEVPHPGGDVV